jgi:hypothetical protein
MGSGDKAQIVKGISKEEVAEKYNIDPDLISAKEPNYMPLDIDASCMKEFAMDSVKYFLIAPNPLLTFSEFNKEVSYDDAKELINIAKIDLSKKPDDDLGINNSIKNVLDNPVKILVCQQQSMSFAMQGLSELDSTIPGLGDNILKAAMQSQAEYGDVLASMIKSTKPKGKEKAPEEHVVGRDDTDWLNNLVSNTKNSMNDAFNDPDMQQFLQTLGNNSNFNFEDNA